MIMKTSKTSLILSLLLLLAGGTATAQQTIEEATAGSGVARAHESAPAGTVPPPQGVTEPDTAQVLSAAQAFLTAFNNLDWEAFHASFAPSATVFQPFGEPWRNDGRENIAAFFGRLFEEIRSSTEGPPYMNITPRDLRIEMLEDAGIVTFHLPGRETVGRRTLVFGRQRRGTSSICTRRPSSGRRAVKPGGRMRGTWSPARRRAMRAAMRPKVATPPG